MASPIDFSPLRQRQIYGQVPMQPSPTMPDQGVIDPMMNVGPELPIGPQTPEEIDTIARMQQLYQPETGMSDQFNQLLANMPVRKRPGKLRKLGASFIALKNPKLAEHALYAPYEHELEDWETRMRPTQAAANLERQENIERRRFAESTVKGEREERKITETERTHKAKEAIAEKRAQVYAAKQNNPKLVFKTREDGMIVGLDPSSGQQVETGLKSNELSDIDKLQLGIEGKIKVEKAKTGEVIKRTAAESAARIEEAKAKGWEVYNTQDGKTIAINPDTRESEVIEGTGGPVTKPVTPSSRTTSPAGEQTSMLNRAQKFKISNPSLSRWVKVQGRQVTITPPKTGRFGSGPTEAEYNKIRDALIGGEKVIEQNMRPPTAPTKTPAPGKTPVKPARPGHLKIINPITGQTGDYPKDKPLPVGWQYAFEE